MRRGLLSFICFLMASLLSVAYPYSPREFIIQGEVSPILSFALDIDASVLPFDMKGGDVQPIGESDWMTSAGLKIGTWSLKADYSTITMTFSLTKFTLNGSQIDYHLQFENPSWNESYSEKYFHVTSKTNNIQQLILSKSEEGIMETGDMDICLFMENDSDTLGSRNYSSGEYSSTLTVEVVANE